MGTRMEGRFAPFFLNNITVRRPLFGLISRKKRLNLGWGAIRWFELEGGERAGDEFKPGG